MKKPSAAFAFNYHAPRYSGIHDIKGREKAIIADSAVYVHAWASLGLSKSEMAKRFVYSEPPKQIIWHLGQAIKDRQIERVRYKV